MKQTWHELFEHCDMTRKDNLRDTELRIISKVSFNLIGV